MAASRYTPWATAKASTAAPTGARRAASATATPSTAVPDGQTGAQHLGGAAAVEAGQPGVAEVGQGLGQRPGGHHRHEHDGQRRPAAQQRRRHRVRRGRQAVEHRVTDVRPGVGRPQVGGRRWLRRPADRPAVHLVGEREHVRAAVAGPQHRPGEPGLGLQRRGDLQGVDGGRAHLPHLPAQPVHGRVGLGGAELGRGGGDDASRAVTSAPAHGTAGTGRVGRPRARHGDGGDGRARAADQAGHARG